MTAQPGREEQIAAIEARAARATSGITTDLARYDTIARPDSADRVLPAWGPGVRYKVDAVLDRADLLKMIRGLVTAPASGWQDEKPTRGKWWLAMLPAKRSGSAVVAVVVDGTGFVHAAWSMRVIGNIAEGLFIKSKWMRRETPADPFAGGGK